MAASWSKLSYLRKFGLKLTSARRKIPQQLHNLTCPSRNQIVCARLLSSTKTYKQNLRKDVSLPLDKVHNPDTVEADWYEWWQKEGLFTPQHRQSTDSFVVVFPPPNVTGTLHLGHALTASVQDALVRWNRMSGKQTVWIPGMDHAGIATQAVVERKVWREERKTRHDLGRGEFVNRIWQFKNKNGQFITKQLKRLGLSFDWSREFFTLNENHNEAVIEAFCQLYDKGLIYQDKRMVNWSCAFRSSVSDIEVDKVKFDRATLLRIPGEKEPIEFGVISSFAYPVVGSDEHLVVSTTRLETMLADVAVAVNPDDPRYCHLVGKYVQHPIIKGRQLLVIADNFVDMSFATGVVKVTPGHDYTDFEVGQRHNLDVIDILEDDGIVKQGVPLVGGMTRFAARRKLKDVLNNMGLYRGDIDHSTLLPMCSRSGDVIEPRLKTQWFLDCKQMADKALQAVESGELTLIPDYNRKIWKEWLSDIQDWCLSRQLWWGHPIPVYTHQESGQLVCAKTEFEAKQKVSKLLGVSADDITLIQDEDVLDTWFSSALLPFSSLGWPHQTNELSSFFPNSLMETGQDILFFWVARMVMLGQELTGQLPFHKVLLHGMIRDSHGRKMSKSLGNVIDPLDVVNGISLQDLHKRLETGNLDPDEIAAAKESQRNDFPKGIAPCGADALRMTLCSYNFKNVDVNFNVEHAESKRRFCNKIWQSFRFLFHHWGHDFVPANKFQLTGNETGTDLWILSRLSHMVESCDQHFKSHDLHLVTASLQAFWHQDMCDVYLESVKPTLSQDDLDRKQIVRDILHVCADTFIRALTPFMPFISEELYQCMTHKDEEIKSVNLVAYPKPEQYVWSNPQMEDSMSFVLDLVSHVQRLRKDYNLMASKSTTYIHTNSKDNSVAEMLEQHHDCFLSLSRSGKVIVLSSTEPAPLKCASSVVDSTITVYVELVGSNVDVDKEVTRLIAKQTKLETQLSRIRMKFDKMEAKGKQHLPVAKDLNQKIQSFEKQLEEVTAKLDMLKSVQNDNK